MTNPQRVSLSLVKNLRTFTSVKSVKYQVMSLHASPSPRVLLSPASAPACFFLWNSIFSSHLPLTSPTLIFPPCVPSCYAPVLKCPVIVHPTLLLSLRALIARQLKLNSPFGLLSGSNHYPPTRSLLLSSIKFYTSLLFLEPPYLSLTIDYFRTIALTHRLM